MPRFRFTIEYDGRPFVGWQRQKQGQSVQGSIETAIAAVTGRSVAVIGAGRTDAGVHAAAMVAHADIETALSPSRIMAAINARLRPIPIAILGCEPVAADFHARFSCTSRSYRYRIVNRRAPLTTDLGLAWRINRPLDENMMQAAARQLVGCHDFTTFRSVHCQSASPVKTLDYLTVQRTGEAVVIDAKARSFLHHQVRSMVGCLSLVGLGKWTLEDMQAALDAVDRRALGLNAPPDGLTFIRAEFTPRAETNLSYQSAGC